MEGADLVFLEDVGGILAVLVEDLIKCDWSIIVAEWLLFCPWRNHVKNVHSISLTFGDAWIMRNSG